jgi:hypothetical protein
MSNRVKAEKHPIHFVASELGVDRMLLTRQLDATGVEYKDGVTFRDAYAALSGKTERDADRGRRQRAEADTAEMTAAKKRDELMFAKDAIARWADVLVEQRKFILTKPQWDSDKLLVGLAKIRLSEQ